MISSYVFQLAGNSVDEIVMKFGLQNVLSNSRTNIFQNEQMRLCIDKKVVRVILFDKKNTTLLQQLRKYFYGDEYEEI